MSNNIIFYCPCLGTKHYFNASILGQVTTYELGTGVRRTMANGVNGGYLRMPANAINFLFTNTMPTTLTIEWWQRNIGSYGCILMPSNLQDSQKLQTQVNSASGNLTRVYFENRNGNLNIAGLQIPNNEWTHVAYTQDYANSRTYCHINGVYQASASTNNNEYAWKLFCIGGKSSSVSSASEYFGGEIDEVIITSGAKYPYEQNFTPSTQTPSLTGLTAGGTEEVPEQDEYISNITTDGTNRLIKARAIQEINNQSNIKEWIGTIAQYEALAIKDQNTIYHITDDIGGYASPNVSTLTNLLNNKQDLCTHIVETYDNGSYWYRVWSDGYCEQGGMTPYQSGVNDEVVTFPRPYRALPYVTISATTTYGSFIDGAINIFNLSTTGFTKQYVKSVGGGWTWMAKGYLA